MSPVEFFSIAAYMRWLLDGAIATRTLPTSAAGRPPAIAAPHVAPESVDFRIPTPFTAANHVAAFVGSTATSIVSLVMTSFQVVPESMDRHNPPLHALAPGAPFASAATRSVADAAGFTAMSPMWQLSNVAPPTLAHAPPPFVER